MKDVNLINELKLEIYKLKQEIKALTAENESLLNKSTVSGKPDMGPSGKKLLEKAEQALNQSHNLLRYVIEHNSGAVAVHDRNMNYIYVSQRYLSDYRIKEKDIIGRNHYEIFPDLPLKWRKAHQEALKGKVLKKEGDIYEKADGTIEWTRWECRPWYETENVIGGIIIYTEIITERKNIEITLRRNESLLNAIFNSAPVIMMLVSERAEILKINRFALESTDQEAEGVAGLGPGNVLRCINSFNDIRGCGFRPDCKLCKIRNIILRTFTTGKESLKTEADIVICGNTQIRRHTMLISTSIISSVPDKQVLLTIDDITARKELENDLINAKEKAEESDKLKSAFLANISHEIRTPMNGIIGFSDMILKPGISDEKRKYFSGLITDGCKQLLSIISDVIDISRIDTAQVSAKISEVNVNDLMIDIFASYHSLADNKNLKFQHKKDSSGKKTIIKTDREKLRQILTNLISNAVKFTNMGTIEYGYTQKDDAIEFYVSDTGIGINPELHSVIFERFRQVETSDTRIYRGTGLGLSIAKGLVEFLGGKIWLKSKPGTGSVFYFTIPLMNKVSVRLPTIEPTLTAGDEPAEILVAEDDDINYLFYEEALHSMNHISYHARNGVEAVECFKLNPSIKMILMDLKMPVMDGFEAARIIRGINPDIPIIAQTAYFSSDIQEMKNFSGYISKPVNREKLSKLLEKHLKITRSA